jgi:hypothetical protein
MTAMMIQASGLGSVMGGGLPYVQPHPLDIAHSDNLRHAGRYCGARSLPARRPICVHNQSTIDNPGNYLCEGFRNSGKFYHST